jgi:HAE1 family hydrophobic/amphiphilic exporter-1
VNFSEPFVRRPVMTVVLTASIILFGVLAYLSLPVNDLPAVDYPVIQVSVGYPGATPETMANNVATPLERQFMQIPGLELVTSSSGQGSTSFVLQFALSKNVDAAATDVQAAISRAESQLPVDLPAPPTFTKTNPNDQPLIYIGLGSDSVTEGQLWDYASTQVGERISILPGVSQIAVYGAQSAVRIKADPSEMAARNLTLDDLVGAIRNGTAYTGAGQFDGTNRTFLLETQGQLTEADKRCADLSEGRRVRSGKRRRRAHQPPFLGTRCAHSFSDRGPRGVSPCGLERGGSFKGRACALARHRSAVAELGRDRADL